MIEHELAFIPDNKSGSTSSAELDKPTLDSTVIQDVENSNDDFEIDENDLGRVFEVDRFEDNEFTLDAASSGDMVFNLFIEDEEPELVEPQPTENTIAPEMPDYKVPELPQGGLEPNESDLDEQAGIVN